MIRQPPGRVHPTHGNLLNMKGSLPIPLYERAMNCRPQCLPPHTHGNLLNIAFSLSSISYDTSSASTLQSCRWMRPRPGGL